MKILIRKVLVLVILFCNLAVFAQVKTPVYTLADTLRGSLNAERIWWDVQRYELAFKPDYINKTISGSNEILYKVVKANDGKTRMQIDLQEPLLIDSIWFNEKSKLTFEHVGSVWYAQVPAQNNAEVNRVKIFLSWCRTPGETCALGRWFHLHHRFLIPAMDDGCLPGFRCFSLVPQQRPSKR